MSRRFVLSAAAAAALVLTSCGGGGNDSGGGTVPADADVEVNAVDSIAWDSDTYTAAAGEITIYGRNLTNLPHNLHIQTADGSEGLEGFVDLPRRNSDGSLTVTLEPGDYRIVCLIPGHQSMNSLLRVT